MASTWPPIPAPSADFTIDGLTTVIWGTDGIYTSYIVTSATYSERIEEIDIENGTGFEAIVILLAKGHDLELNVVDDSAITPPATGTIVTLSSPYGAIPMLKVADKGNAARKREGERTLTFKSYNAITGLH